MYLLYGCMILLDSPCRFERLRPEERCTNAQQFLLDEKEGKKGVVDRSDKEMLQIISDWPHEMTTCTAEVETDTKREQNKGKKEIYTPRHDSKKATSSQFPRSQLPLNSSPWI